MYFSYEHNPEYQRVQLQLYDAISHMSQQHLVNIINNHPYYVDVLLQMTEWARLNENLPVAAELTEQALYSLEDSFRPMFRLSNIIIQPQKEFLTKIYYHLVFGKS